MAHEINQSTTINGKRLSFSSRAVGEDDCLYDTKVFIDNKEIAIISGRDILDCIVGCCKMNIKQNAAEFPDIKKVIMSFASLPFL